MGFIYSYDNDYSVPSYISTLISGATQLGALFGQLFLGHLADLYGRVRIYKISLLIVLIGMIGSSLSAKLESGLSLYGLYGMWRLFTGIGFGAVYPATALIVCEYAPTKWRGAICAAVKAFQGLAILTGPIISMILLSIYQAINFNNPFNLDSVWRLCIAVGVIPCLITMYLASKVPETPRYTMYIDDNLEKAENDVKFVIDRNEYREFRIIQKKVNKIKFWKDFKKHFAIRDNLKVLIILSVCRFVDNIGLYGINWIIESVLKVIKFGYSQNNYYLLNSSNATQNVYTANIDYSIGISIVALLGAVPGYGLGIIFIEVLGRKKLQLISFFAVFAIFLGLAGSYDTIINKLEKPENAFTGIFFFLQLFLDIGFNTTVFVMPAEYFPTRFRSTAYGISAAVGRIGALIVVGFNFIKDTDFKPSPPVYKQDASKVALYYAFGVLMLVGAIVTFFLPETKRKPYYEIEMHTDNYITR
jgi:PHS family inorganic phosphate transporter-like MFS transporter